MVSCEGELFRRVARDETFGVEMRVVSMNVKLEGLAWGREGRLKSDRRPQPTRRDPSPQDIGSGEAGAAVPGAISSDGYGSPAFAGATPGATPGTNIRPCRRRARTECPHPGWSGAPERGCV